MLTTAIARSRNGTHEAFVRTAAKACLQSGLRKEGTTFFLKPVECPILGIAMKKQMVSFPGKLVQHLKAPANCQYFHIVGRPPFQVLADLPALISKQQRNAQVQAVLSHLRANQCLHVTTIPQQKQATVPQAAPAQHQQAATLVYQAPAQKAAPPKPAQALQTVDSGAGHGNASRHSTSMPPSQQPSKHVSNHCEQCSFCLAAALSTICNASKTNLVQDV